MEEQLLRYGELVGKKIGILSEKEREEIWKSVKKKYLRSDINIGYSICDAINFSLASGVDVSDSYKWIEDYVKNDPIILFFNKEWGNNFYEIENAYVFIEFFDKEHVVTEFYITNRDTNYLLCYNHSQCLVAMGKAIEWLENDERYKERYMK